MMNSQRAMIHTCPYAAMVVLPAVAIVSRKPSSIRRQYDFDPHIKSH